MTSAASSVERHHDRAVPPQPVQRIEVALVLVLDVHDDVDIVQQRPTALAGAFAARRLVSRFAHLFLDLVDDRVDLALVGRRRDDEAVGDHQLSGHIDHHDVVGELDAAARAATVAISMASSDAVTDAFAHPFPGPPRSRSSGRVEPALGHVLHHTVGHQVPDRAGLLRPGCGSRSRRSPARAPRPGSPRRAAIPRSAAAMWSPSSS